MDSFELAQGAFQFGGSCPVRQAKPHLFRRLAGVSLSSPRVERRNGERRPQIRLTVGWIVDQEVRSVQAPPIILERTRWRAAFAWTHNRIYYKSYRVVRLS
jgi:hypothetical protein